MRVASSRRRSASPRKIVVGYILRHHPSWMRFIEEARRLGPPFVMRMNLNQQSVGSTWEVHKRLMESTSPIVDCGVHYVDVMCQIPMPARSRCAAWACGCPMRSRLKCTTMATLQVLFEDGSVGWYEAAWGR